VKWRDRFCKRKSYASRLLSEGVTKLKKEMNLLKFLHRQRVQTTALLSLLTGPQAFFCNKMGRLVLKAESSEPESNVSSDQELNTVDKDSLLFVDKVVNSNDEVDKRLVHLFQIFFKKSLPNYKRNTRMSQMITKKDL